MLLFGILLVTIAISAIITDGLATNAGEQENAAHGIALGAEELGYLANDYVIYHENQQLNRWQTRFASFSQSVAGLQANTPEEQALVNNIVAGQQRLKEVFDSIVTAAGETTQNPTAPVSLSFVQVSWSRIAVQSQGLVADASRLSQLQSDQADRLRRINLVIILAMVGVFGGYYIANYILVQRRTLKSSAM